MSKKKNTKNRRNINTYVLILIIAGCLSFLGLRIFRIASEDPYPEVVFVQRVIDGDTFVDRNKRRFRLIGVDTPELARNNQPEEAFARKATDFTKKHIKHKLVRLEYDREKFDKYNRFLVYVYTTDGKMLNRLLLEEGLAEVYRKADYRYKKEFYNLQNIARKKKKGIWK
jgi:micrococcal nuclease